MYWTVRCKYWTERGKYWTVRGKYWTVSDMYWTVICEYWTVSDKYWTVRGKYWTVSGKYWTVSGLWGACDWHASGLYVTRVWLVCGSCVARVWLVLREFFLRFCSILQIRPRCLKFSNLNWLPPSLSLRLCWRLQATSGGIVYSSSSICHGRSRCKFCSSAWYDRGHNPCRSCICPIWIRVCTSRDLICRISINR